MVKTWAMEAMLAERKDGGIAVGLREGFPDHLKGLFYTVQEGVQW